MKDLYEILGVGKSSSQDEIKKAYRKIAMKFHPDKNPGDANAEQKFKEAAEAYSILKDSTKRSRYDQFGHAGVGLGDTPGGQGYGGGFTHMSMDDIFSQFGDIFGGRNPFEDIFGGGSSPGRAARRARDLRVSLELEPKDILDGVEKTIKIKRNETCHTCTGSGAKPGTQPSSCRQCGGSGQVRQVSRTFFGQSVVLTDCPVCQGEGVMVENPCTSCGGRGVVREEAKVKVKVPKGVSSGNYMSLEGQGHKGERGMQPGDLLVHFEEKPHPYFTRNGNDNLIELNISLIQAIQGATLEIPTIEGKASIKVPAGIQSGQILRMKGKGYPKLRGNLRGDQLVRIKVEIPKSVSGKAKRLVSELEAEIDPPKNPYSKMNI